MQRFHACAVIGALLLTGDAALAGNAALADYAPSTGHTAPLTRAPTGQSGVSQQTANHRQLSDCMTRRMAASRTLSYNEAAKVCKDQIESQRQALSASNAAQPAAATAH
jgi:hypothetical protein